MILSTSEVAICCSRASSNSRVSRATFVPRQGVEELRPGAAFAGLVLRRCALTRLLPVWPRRPTVAPEAQTRDGSNLRRYPGGVGPGTDRCLLRSLADMCSAKSHVCFTPESG